MSAEENAEQIKNAIKGINTNGRDIKVALMCCIVNGHGEARECDVGIAGGRGEAVLFRHGEIIGKITEENIIPTLLNEIEKIVTEK